MQQPTIQPSEALMHEYMQSQGQGQGQMSHMPQQGQGQGQSQGQGQMSQMPQQGQGQGQQYTTLDSSTAEDLLSGLRQVQHAGIPTQLPVQSIPLPGADYIQIDPRAQPNYIPSSSSSSSALMLERGHPMSSLLPVGHGNGNGWSFADTTTWDWHTPLLLCVLYVVFQMPWLRTWLSGWFPSLVRTEDHTWSPQGWVVNGGLFVVLFSVLSKLVFPWIARQLVL